MSVISYRVIISVIFRTFSPTKTRPTGVFVEIPIHFPKKSETPSNNRREYARAGQQHTRLTKK